MSNLRTEFNVDLDNPTHVAAMIAFLSTLNGNAQPSAPVQETTVKETKTASAPIKDRKAPLVSAKKEEKPEVEEKPAVEETPAAEETPAQTSKITIKQVREKLSEKIDSHRDAIIDKLGELGAQSVSTLKEDKYEAFFEYLETLS